MLRSDEDSTHKGRHLRAARTLPTRCSRVHVGCDIDKELDTKTAQVRCMPFEKMFRHARACLTRL